MLRSGPEYTLQRRYYDTFDWRLYRSGNVFEIDGQEPPVCRIRSLGKRGGQFTTAIKQDPDFCWNFEQQDLGQYLEPIISVRRLLLQAEVRVSIEPIEVIDANGKVLLRLELEKYLYPDRNGRYRSTLVNCKFNPLRGYGKVCKQLLELAESETGTAGKIHDPFVSILTQENITPADYSNKFKLTFDPELSIGQALAKTLLFHMGVIRQNLPGLKADLDTEFLHNFRTANRRSRTLITQLKHVLPPVKQRHYKAIFFWLSNKTSEHRDLDVFIHDIPHYMTMLPRNMRDDLEPLGRELEKRRKKAHARLLRLLNSEKFIRFEAEYQSFLVDGLDNHFRTETGQRPVTEIASKSIWKVYKKLLKQGQIARSTGDWVALHELRKIGKKLRYLLETFRSLYPQKDVEQVATDCRKLQNLLGRIVDYRVQQNYLLGLTQGIGVKSRLPASTNACIKKLAVTYGKLEEKSYAKFEDMFARFTDPKSQVQFRTLFKDTR